MSQLEVLIDDSFVPADAAPKRVWVDDAREFDKSTTKAVFVEVLLVGLLIPSRVFADQCPCVYGESNLQ